MTEEKISSRLIILFVIVLASTRLLSQNYIKNGTFSKKRDCPTLLNHEISKCRYWESINGSSPDYFSCGYLGHTDDENFHKSNSFIGLATFVKKQAPLRELVSQKIKSLKKNKIYISNFYIRNEQSLDIKKIRDSQPYVSNMCYLYAGKKKLR